MEIKTMIQSTPNPNALKFVLNMPVKNEGKVTYKNAGQCQHNPMAAALFTVPNVTEVYFFDNYITVTQDGGVDWDEIEEQIKKIVLEYAPTHDPDFKVEEEKRPSTPVSDNPEIAKINAILDNTIRPGLQMDGGDLQIVSFDGTNLIVNYQGACGSCPSSTMGTLKVIESILRDQYNPEIVVQTEGGMVGGYSHGEPY
ncbi:MAG: NifU family protein [Candidatus Omnitrophica bacterium]|nr:NifU family protein [Candidatus Omnitrophota bacterium]MDE2221946.1 NifU family protein [Candidatus Omnitrophota bacterium]